MPAKSVEEYISCHSYWEEELRQLHKMMLTTELEPAIKWGAPVYTIAGKNVVGIGAFKNHYGIWFFNGALLRKHTALLINAQEGKTKALRQIKFKKGEEINTTILLPYVKEAIQHQKEGREIKPAKKKELIVPPELSSALKKDPELESAFKKLSPGKQREYADHISEAKKEVTRQNRLDKVIPMIKCGAGLYDRYKNC